MHGLIKKHENYLDNTNVLMEKILPGCVSALLFLQINIFL